jgi:hypothetical protein
MLRKLVGLVEEQCKEILTAKGLVGVHGDWYVESVEAIADSDSFKVKCWFEQSDTPDEDIVMSREEVVEKVLKAIGDRVLEQLDWEKSNGRHKFESGY